MKLDLHAAPRMMAPESLLDRPTRTLRQMDSAVDRERLDEGRPVCDYRKSGGGTDQKWNRPRSYLETVVPSDRDPRRPGPEVPSANSSPTAKVSAVCDDKHGETDKRCRRPRKVRDPSPRVRSWPRAGDQRHQQEEVNNNEKERSSEERPLTEPEYRFKKGVQRSKDTDRHAPSRLSNCWQRSIELIVPTPTPATCQLNRKYQTST